MLVSIYVLVWVVITVRLFAQVDVMEGVWLCQSPDACIGQDTVTDAVCAERRAPGNSIRDAL
eukprot:1372604-Amphidinium_carterae.1